MVRSVLRRGPIPTEGFPPVATAVPVTIPALPPLPDKAPPLPAAVKPITPDSPDIRPTHMLSPPMQLGFANTSFGHFSRSQIPSCNPAEQALNKGSPCEVVPSCSHGVHAERRDPGQILIRQTEENRRSSGISQAGSHSSQAVPAQGASLPPIPAAHSAGSPPIPKGRAGKGVAHPASKAPGVSSTRGKHSMKSKGSRPNIIVPAGARSKPAPGWNDDFSVQYSDPVSIKDQERHMSKTHQGSAKQSQMPSGHTALQPPGGQSAAAQHGPAKQASSVGSAAGASRAHKPPAVPWTQQGCRPPAAHEPSDQCVDTVYMNDDWECSLQSAQIGCSSVHSRNLDSAQSPLRPLKGEHGSSIGVCGQAELDKASSTSVKVSVCRSHLQNLQSCNLATADNSFISLDSLKHIHQDLVGKVLK